MPSITAPIVPIPVHKLSVSMKNIAKQVNLRALFWRNDRLEQDDKKHAEPRV